MLKTLTKNCIDCKKEITKPYNESLVDWEERHKYCSVGCMDAFRKGRSFKHFKQFSKGHIPWNKGMKGVMAGDKSSQWRGGITPLHIKIRKSIEGRSWVQSVFARDGYTCKKTGVKGGKLTAHHVLNFSNHPEVRFAIDNGITLSIESHKEFHKKYGKENNTREQLLEFLSKKDL